ncbi:MAG: hypothetical protein ABR906_00240 [Terracidiphilus sp.]|jgi:hypothetical protein
MLGRKLLHNLLPTATVVVFFFVLDRRSITGFEARLTVGLCLTLLLIIWSEWLKARRLRLTASYPCLFGFYFVLFLVERGPGDLGTLIGGAGFLLGLALLFRRLRSKKEPTPDEVS